MKIVCPCGSTQTVWTQSHEQCAKCGRVLASCCEGGSCDVALREENDQREAAAKESSTR